MWTCWADEHADEWGSGVVSEPIPVPSACVQAQVKTYEFMAEVIKDMHVRGAGLIGAAAGYGMYLAALSAPTDSIEAFQKYLEAAGMRVLK